MTVSVKDKRRRKNSCGGLDLANGTWFEILGLEGMDKLVNTQRTNDKMDVSAATAKKMAVIVADWTPSKWKEDVAMWRMVKLSVIELFLLCNGFRTS